MAGDPAEPRDDTDRISAFDPGFVGEERNENIDIQIDISRLVARIEAMPSHRSYSLAITKLDEAQHWLKDRHHRPASSPRR